MVDITEIFIKNCKLFTSSQDTFVYKDCDVKSNFSEFTKTSLTLYEELRRISFVLSQSFSVTSQQHKILPYFSTISKYETVRISTADAIAALNKCTIEWNKLKNLFEEEKANRNKLSSSTWFDHCKEVISQLYSSMSTLASIVDTRNRSTALQQSAKKKYFVISYRGNDLHLSKEQLQQINENDALNFLPTSWHSSSLPTSYSSSSPSLSLNSVLHAKGSSCEGKALSTEVSSKLNSKPNTLKQIHESNYAENSSPVSNNLSNSLFLPEEIKSTLEVESQQLLDTYHDDLAVLHDTQKVVAGMSELMSFFAYKAVEQTELSYQISSVATETLKNIENAEIHLNKALKHTSKYRIYIVLFFLISSFILICFDMIKSKNWF